MGSTNYNHEGNHNIYKFCWEKILGNEQGNILIIVILIIIMINDNHGLLFEGTILKK